MYLTASNTLLSSQALLANGVLISGAERFGFPEADADATTQTISFVHINDLHGCYHPEATGGNPAARLYGFYQSVRATNPYTLFTHAGDAYEKGSVAEHKSDGLTTRQVFNVLKPHVGVIGNHDFAFSPNELLAYSCSPDTVMLLSNADFVGHNPLAYGALKYALMDIGNVRVGFFGMVSKCYDSRDNLTDEDPYPHILKHRHDYVNVAQEIVHGPLSGADLVVMVSHIGPEAAQEVMTMVSGIHLTLGGHSHDVISTPVIWAATHGAYYVQADAYARYAARVDVEVDLASKGVRIQNCDMVPNEPAIMPTDAAAEKAINELVWQYASDEPLTWIANHQSRVDVADIAARAGLEHLDVDVAIVDRDTVWVKEGLEEGSLNEQQLFKTFEVEQEPSGTEGFSDFFIAQLTAAELIAIRLRAMWDSDFAMRWRYQGPSMTELQEMDPEATLRVAMPKKAAWNLKHYMDIEERASEYGCAIFQAVAAYGRLRTRRGLHLDDDTPLV